MTVTAASQKGFTDHGAGVWENPQDHSIWYREGSTLRRRNVNIDRMISDYLSTLPKST